MNFSDNLDQAYTVHRKELRVAITSFYDKIKATETGVSEAVVARVADVASELQVQRVSYADAPIAGKLS